MKPTSLKFLRHAILSTLALSVFCAAAESPPIDRDFTLDVQPSGLPEKFTFKARNLFNHADYLASDECNGRLAGSEGEAKAREYIVKRLHAIGYENVRHFMFTFTGDVKMGPNNSLTATTLGKNESSATKYELIDDFKPMPISAPGEGAGDLVFVGFGISAPEKGYDDYAGIEAKDKVVLAFRGEPEKADGTRIGGANDPHAAANVYSDLFYKAGVARDHGARALLLIDGERGKAPPKKIMPDMIRGGGRRHCGFPLIQVLPDVAEKWIDGASIAPGEKKLVESATLAELKKKISAELKPSSFAVPGLNIGFNVDIIREKATDYNLAVVLPGNDAVLKNEIVVIGAHYDHLGTGNEFSLADKADMGKIHRGADDNASGTSSVLELADALYKNRAALKRTVWIMFFGAEEMGTIGSNDFVKNPPEDFKVSNVAAMLNLDMVGRCRDNKVMVYGASTGKGFDDVLKSSDKELGLDIKTTADGFGGSDQTAFVTAGIPVLFFFTGSHPDYHKPSDTADKLDVAAQAKITGLAFNVAANLINAPERPKFVKIDAPRMSGGMNGIRLGTLPDYAYDGKGLRINGVRDASPADKAGLKAGDILIMLGGRKIENINDYMNALAQAKPNVETPLKILRDGKEMEVKVVPEQK
ncbi:MAG TPA: M20/M25/M40 family metallo-hydrolase [Planctomycetota bacterium]|nr:M20/M25/M40 family metallo-hydrolase [Planctomycetota bacterium]